MAKKGKSKPSRRIAPEKAREMLKNPPHNKPLTPAQERLFQAAAHKDKGKKGKR